MKHKNIFDMSSPKVQVAMGVVWGIAACALKSYTGIALNESILDIVLTQYVILVFMSAIELATAVVCKFEDFRDKDEKLLICGVFAIAAATLALGLLLEFPIFGYVSFAFVIPYVIMFGNKFYFKYFTATMALMSLFVVAWQ